MDYDFSGLSWRSFEQLVQALAARVVGPAIVAFGDGPDQGREATFEGRMPYAPRGLEWDGYLVVQAKFRQRPSARADEGWALRELQQELSKFAEQKGDRRRPDYFIFATNVILGPAGGGGKDRCLAALEHAREEWGLTDYDVWDYDKLRVFLDDYEAIRHAYAAWLTPGDVLASVMRWIEGATPGFEATIANYLLPADKVHGRLDRRGSTRDFPRHSSSSIFRCLGFEGAIRSFSAGSI